MIRNPQSNNHFRTFHVLILILTFHFEILRCDNNYSNGTFPRYHDLQRSIPFPCAFISFPLGLEVLIPPYHMF